MDPRNLVAVYWAKPQPFGGEKGQNGNYIGGFRLPAQDGAAPADRHAAASLTRGHLKVLFVDLLDVVKLLVVLRVLVALGLGSALLLHAGLGLRGSRTVLGGAQAQQISVMSAPGNLPIDSAKKAGEGNAENGCVGACSHVRVCD